MLSRPSGPRCSGPTRRPCPCIPTWWVPAFIMPNGSCPALPIMTLMSLRCKAMIPSPVTSPFRGSSRSWKNRSLPIPGSTAFSFLPRGTGCSAPLPSPGWTAPNTKPFRRSCSWTSRTGSLPPTGAGNGRATRRAGSITWCGLSSTHAGDPSRAGRRRLPL